MTADFCVEALEEAISRYGAPEMLQHRPGLAIYGGELHRCAAEKQIRISMDWTRCVARQRVRRGGCGKSVKYEEVYLHAYDSVAAAKAGIQRYFSFYNSRRPHSSLTGRLRITFTSTLSRLRWLHKPAEFHLSRPRNLSKLWDHLYWPWTSLLYGRYVWHDINDRFFFASSSLRPLLFKSSRSML